jgi:hypothetical protein
MSAVSLGYLNDPFAEAFSPGPAIRRYPIINRGMLPRSRFSAGTENERICPFLRVFRFIHPHKIFGHVNPEISSVNIRLNA